MAYTLNHEFFDKLKYSDSPDYLKSLREFGTGFDRSELATLTGLSSHTIRRYESEWKTSNVPQWYELLLRLISGDLSYFGHHWHHCRIQPQTQKLSIPHDKYKAYLPMDMHTQQNLIYRTIKNENSKIQADNEALKKRIAALEIEIELLAVQIKRLEHENARFKAERSGIKKGTVVPLFSQK